jgi:uncharacterized protein (DUF885 family)
MSKLACVAIGLALGAIALASSAQTAEPPKNKELHALFDREFKNALEENPEAATFIGVPGYDDRLTDRSPAAVARRKAHVGAVMKELHAFDKVALSTQDRLSRDVMIDNLELQQAVNRIYGDLPFGAGDSWLLVSPMFGPQQMYALLAKATPFRRTADYENYLKRLEKIPHALDEVTDRLREGMASGWMPPRAAMLRVPSMMEVFAGADVKATPLWHPFESFPADMSAADRTRLAERGRRALAEGVHPAFAKLKRFVEETYLPACRTDLASSKLPGGPAYYALMVKMATTTTLTPQEIHKIGENEVKRIHGEMEKVIAEAGFKGSFADFVKFLNTDKRFFYKTSDERLAAYRDIAKQADAELPKLFAELPRLPYGVRAMDASEGDNADHYSRGAIDGSRAGFFEANVNNVEKKPSPEMVSVLLHETVPGHHLQIARAQELKDLPLFRRAGGYNAYSEGWALYAESLGYEMNMYKDPYQHFGALQAEMLRACRLVVDTGIHAMNWTRDDGLRCLIEEAGYHPDVAAAEVDRYIVWPGQALGYKVGELKIKALRAKAKAALDGAFDVRRFHNAVLDDGALPLTVLETRIDEWIATQRKKP